MEPYIPISMLNDFIFCPRSIFFSNVHGSLGQKMIHRTAQTEGKLAHESIEEGSYSTRSDILMNTDVYCEKYNLMGKIDLFEITTGRLIERKNKIATIYDGYIFQVYAQYFSLCEMNYRVNEIVIRDRTHNKNYPILLPKDNPIMLQKFETTIKSLKEFDLNKTSFTPNKQKCENCIYSTICDYSLC